jgi:hypothetical protein
MGKYWVGLGEVGIWDRLWDSDLRQRRDLNDVAVQEQILAGDLQSLAQQVKGLRQTIFEMSVMNTVVMKMLSEAGHLDLTVLKYRIEAEIDAITEANAEHGPQVACSRCNKTVPANQTIITDLGPYCDTCAAALPPR